MKPTKEEVIEAIQTINDLALYAAIHNMFNDPVNGLINTCNWLKKEYSITDGELNDTQRNYNKKEL